jgi:IclR family KDG regulon transcriptional repressor
MFLVGESINLGVLEEHEQRVVYVHTRESAYNLSMKSTLGQRNPLHNTSLGKALLAFRDEDEIAERKMGFEQTAPNTIRDAESLRAALEETRAQGFAEEIEEAETDVRC